VPPDERRELIAVTDTLMDHLDLRVFEIMDYSEGNRLIGNLNQPRDIVDAFYEGIPDAIGFVNGYGPAGTFAARDGVPFMSYDYYLNEDRPAGEAVADLQELARFNQRRPYFLLMHVRQRSSIERVQKILNRLGPDFEVVPLDIFMNMAGNAPTFETHYRAEDAPVRDDVVRRRR
jgi:hypothetical protein